MQVKKSMLQKAIKKSLRKRGWTGANKGAIILSQFYLFWYIFIVIVSIARWECSEGTGRWDGSALKAQGGGMGVLWRHGAVRWECSESTGRWDGLWRHGAVRSECSEGTGLWDGRWRHGAVRWECPAGTRRWDGRWRHGAVRWSALEARGGEIGVLSRHEAVTDSKISV